MKDYIDKNASQDYLNESVRTKPGLTRQGKTFDHYIQRRVQSGKLKLECIGKEILGTLRPLEIYRAERKDEFIKPWPRKNEMYCPAHWADIKIGYGPCGYRCRTCFLNLTARTMGDPSRHILYSNVDDCEREVIDWLKRPDRNSLGLGIDCSDSLLYEGVTGYARKFIPLLSEPKTNPHNRTLILLTKSANVHYLKRLPSKNIIISFSVNPEKIADLWEGKFPDGPRITPSIEKRIEAARLAKERGFTVRFRIDPIIPCENWEEIYRNWIFGISEIINPERITLGTYRETGRSLRTFSKTWGLPSMEWNPPQLIKEIDHWHIPDRLEIYLKIKEIIEEAFKPSPPIIALCKEPKEIKEKCGLMHYECNCAPLHFQD